MKAKVQIPKHNFKDLETYIDNMEGTTIPIFGYPVIDFDSNGPSTWASISGCLVHNKKRFQYLTDIMD